MKRRPDYYARYLLVLSLLLSAACTENEPMAITGQWKATALEEEGEALNVQLDKIQFSFYPDARYDYKSTLNYREAGHYQLKSKYLYTTDTLNEASVEKVVEVTRLLADTMVIRMEQNGKERVLTLTRTE
jgi:hypothetical protein